MAPRGIQTPPKGEGPRSFPGTGEGEDASGKGVSRSSTDHHSAAPIVCVFGKRRSGKTTLTKKLIRGRQRLVVFDPLGEYEGRQVDHPLALLRAIRKAKRFHIVYRPKEARREFPAVAEIVFLVGSLCLVAEEISWAISPSRMDKRVEVLIRMGRHKGVELFGVSQRPASVNRDLTANASTIYIFRTTEPRDLAYFRETIGREEAQKLPRLPAFTPYVWRDDAEKTGEFSQGERLSKTLASGKRKGDRGRNFERGGLRCPASR